MKLVDWIDRCPARVAFGRGGGTGAGSTPAQIFESRAHVVATAVGDPYLSHLTTAGYGAPGDGGAALYVRAAAEPAHPGKVRSADGTWWEYVPGPRGIDVRAFGAVGEGDATQAFRDALETALALASAHRYSAANGPSYTGSWDKGMPPIAIPAGTYGVDLSGGPLWSFPQDRALRGIHVAGAGRDTSFLRITGGTGSWLIVNDNGAMDISVRDLSVHDETGNGNGFYRVSSTGTAKRHVFRDVITQHMAGISINGTANGDHLRCDNVQFDRVPAGRTAVAIDNPQAVDHQFRGCEITNLLGTGLHVTAGGVVSWYGGSIVIGRGGRFVHVEGPGSAIGSGNNSCDFHNVKCEMRAFGGASGDPSLILLDANAVINLWGGTFQTDEVSATRTTDPIVIRRGRLNVHGASTWSGNYKVTLAGFDGAAVSDLPPEVVFHACHLKAQLADIVTIDDPSSPAGLYAAAGRAAAVGCFGDGTKRPVDVSLNHGRGRSSLAAARRRGVFVNGTARDSALPGATPFTFQLPRGAMVVAAGVWHDGTSPAAATSTYVIRDGNGTVLHSTAAIGHDTDTVDAADGICRVLSDDVAATFSCENTGDGIAQRGHVFVEWY